MIRFFVPGKPVPKGRPRATIVRGRDEIRMTRFGPMLTGRAKPRVYTPAKTIEGEANVRAAFMEKYRVDPATGPLRIEICAVFVPPKSISGARRGRMMNGEEYPEGREDVDNLLKLIMDALEGLAYKRDSQIVTAVTRKRYGNPEGVHVEIDRINAIGGK